MAHHKCCVTLTCDKFPVKLFSNLDHNSAAWSWWCRPTVLVGWNSQVPESLLHSLHNDSLTTVQHAIHSQIWRVAIAKSTASKTEKSMKEKLRRKLVKNRNPKTMADSVTESRRCRNGSLYSLWEWLMESVLSAERKKWLRQYVRGVLRIRYASFRRL